MLIHREFFIEWCCQCVHNKSQHRACCMIRNVCSAPLIYGRLSGIKGSFFSTDSLFHCLTASAFALFVATTNFQSWQFFEDGASIPGWRILVIASLSTTLLLYFLMLLLFFIDSIVFLLLYLVRHIDQSVDVSNSRMSPIAFGRSTTSPTFLIFPSVSSTELHTKLLLFPRLSIHSSFVYCTFRPFVFHR